MSTDAIAPVSPGVRSTTRALNKAWIPLNDRADRRGLAVPYGKVRGLCSDDPLFRASS